MIAILAICTHICPCSKQLLSSSSAVGMDEPSLSKYIREKHGSPLSKECYTDIFVSCAPKFIAPAVPYYYDTTSNTLVAHPLEHAYKTQVRLLDQRELSTHSSFRKLRSYLKLYTSIPVRKLQSFFSPSSTTTTTTTDELVDTYSTEELLLSFKVTMNQVESIVISKQGNDTATTEGTSNGSSTTNAMIQLKSSSTSTSSALDIHYYLDMDTVHVDEAEKQRRFENYFVAQIIQNLELHSKVQEVVTEV